jgi:hypothetical protein
MSWCRRNTDTNSSLALEGDIIWPFGLTGRLFSSKRALYANVSEFRHRLEAS